MPRTQPAKKKLTTRRKTEKAPALAVNLDLTGAAPTLDELTGATKIGDTIYSHARYDELLAKVMTMVANLGVVKGGEYAGDTDRLANFRRNGKKMDVPMEIIWGVYFAKHEDAVMQYIQDVKNNRTRPRNEPISGRVLDMITYSILFLAILDEKGEAI